METTFVITPAELNSSFLASLKTLFKHKNQLQISISVSEDFKLLETESPKQCIARLEKCLNEMSKAQNTISFSESQLDEIIFEKL